METVRPVGRPKNGRRSNPDYRQHSVWLSDSLCVEVWDKLETPEGKRYEFSALVETLLRKWVDAGGKLPK